MLEKIGIPVSAPPDVRWWGFAADPSEVFSGLLAQNPPSLAIHRPNNATLTAEGGISTLPLACTLMAEIRSKATRAVALDAGGITELAECEVARRGDDVGVRGCIGGEVRGIDDAGGTAAA